MAKSGNRVRVFTVMWAGHPIFRVPCSLVRLDVAGFSLKYCLPNWQSSHLISLRSTVEFNRSDFLVCVARTPMFFGLYVNNASIDPCACVVRVTTQGKNSYTFLVSFCFLTLLSEDYNVVIVVVQ